MKDNFLLEIGTEEIPASYIIPALSQLEVSLSQLLGKETLTYTSMATTATPRRLTVFIHGLQLRQDDKEQLFTGPPMDAAYKEDKPTPAAHGFAKSRDVSLDECMSIERNNRQYLAVKKNIAGKMTGEILQEHLPAIIGNITFPKSMRWTELPVRFARPVRWIAALLGKDVVGFTFGNVTSGRITHGHRFLKKEDPVHIENADWKHYLAILEKNGVIADYQRRKSMIAGYIAREQKKYHPDFSENHISQELLDEVNFLCEYPSIGEGTFSEKYLELPAPVLITTMTHHQKYFPVYDSECKLKPKFLFICNNLAQYEKVIRKGNEKVLHARLEDALFFYGEDLKIPLAQRKESLEGILFQKGLGTYLDKVERLENLVPKLSSLTDTDTKMLSRAASLCKNDLTTNMVYEFPELQGTVGRLYALENGEHESIARAVEEHYLPRQQNDPVPGSDTAKLLSVIDKLDTLIGLIGNGNMPSGSKDPFGLRRAALGIVRIMIEGSLDFDLADLYKPSYELFSSLKEEAEALKTTLFTFIKQRLIHYLSEEKGFRDDLVDACFPPLQANFYHNYRKLQALSEISQESQFDDLTTSFKRIGNIIAQAKEKFSGWEQQKPVIDLLKEPAEKELFMHFEQLKKDFEKLSQAREYSLLLRKFSELRPHIDRFFDEVLVMDPDEKLRYNRINLLAQLNEAFLIVADFTRIRGEQSTS